MDAPMGGVGPGGADPSKAKPQSGGAVGPSTQDGNVTVERSVDRVARAPTSDLLAKSRGDPSGSLAS